jgi:hypothetical protein
VVVVEGEALTGVQRSRATSDQHGVGHQSLQLGSRVKHPRQLRRQFVVHDAKLSESIISAIPRRRVRAGAADVRRECRGA